MQLTKVRLKNFGPYEDSTYELSQGLIGIVGPNGSGKSTLVNGIYACLTNDFSRFEGRKAGIIRDTAGERDSSLVSVVGNHNGASFQLTRSLRPNRSKLDIRDKSYTKAADIEQHLIKDLGLNRRLIDAYVFVNQWDMFSFLDQTDSKRAAVFQYLCGTEKSTDIYDACTKFATDERFTERGSDNSDQINVELAYAEKELRELQLQYEDCSQYLMEDKSLDSVEKIIRRRDVLKGQQEELSTRDKTSVIAKREIRKLKKMLIQEKCEYEKLHNAVGVADKKLVALQVDEANYTTAQRLVARRESLLLKRSSYEKIKPVFKLPDKKICPTCSQVVTDDELEAIYKKEFQLNLRAYGESLEKVDSELASIEVDESHLNFKPDRLEQAKEVCYHLEDEQAKTNKKVIDFELKLARQEGEFNACQQRITVLETHLQGSSLEEYNKLYARAKRRRREHYDYKEKSDHLDGAIKAKQGTVVRYRKLLASLEEQKAIAAKYGDLLDVVLEARELFHWQKLPRQVAQANLGAITGEINAGLENFGSPFWVEADVNLSFKVHFPGAPSRAAAALSGGQKVVLAICFRAAVNCLFGQNISMMFLDEPTSGLDDENIEYFREVLVKMANKIRGKYQLFVVTHEEALTPAFDRTVLIGER